MVLWELFVTFLVIGCVSFGGGYAMLPLIGSEVERHGWMGSAEFLNLTAVAGMSPGPIAANTAIFVGYRTAGFGGAVVSALGMVLPSFALVLLVGAFFYRIHNHRWVRSALYGLHAVTTGLIFYGAFTFAFNSRLFTLDLELESLFTWFIFAASLLALLKFKLHPVSVIILSGLCGAAVLG